MNPTAVLFWAILFGIGFLSGGINWAIGLMLVGMVISFLITLFVRG